MTDQKSAHSHPWKISDVVIFPLLAIAFLSEWLWATEIGLPRLIGVLIGGVLTCVGGALIFWTKVMFKKAAQGMGPGSAITTLITSGPFRFSRNPNYLGAGMALLGAAFLFDTLWPVATTLVTLAILDQWMIRPEEQYLSETFGQQYEAYRSRVRRWL